MIIEWKEVITEPGFLISNNGYVLNRDTQVIRKLKTHPEGYRHLFFGRPKKEYKIHRLVATHFVHNPLNLPVVNHINGIKGDNNVTNLEWATHKHNTQHAIASGLMNNKGSRNGMSKLTEEIIKEVRALKRCGVSAKKISNAYKIDLRHVFGICSRKSWAHVD